MIYTEMARRVRHDLIKHLDIPAPGQMLSEAEARVLLRRLFDSANGICQMATVWSFRLRHDDNWNEALSPYLDSILHHCQKLTSFESDLKKNLLDGGTVDGEIIGLLQQIVESVHDFDAQCMQLYQAENGAESVDDEAAALEFFQFAPPEETAPDPPEPSLPFPETPIERRLRILVVDDNLMSIDRLQSHPQFRERFTWATLCDENIGCLECPKRDGCQLRRARNYRETLEALMRMQQRHQKLDALLMDVRFDALEPQELLWLPEMPHINQEEQVKSLQGLIIARRLRQNPQFRELPIVLMTTRSRLPENAARLLQDLEGLQFVDDEASLDVLATRLESVARIGNESPVESGYFWGTSARVQNIRRQIEIMSIGPRTMFITGPSGSGKSSLVEHIIYPLSGRNKLVTLDLSSVPDTLVESELFGHVKGAYSGATHDRAGLVEEADGGILFLDEIGNLSLENQRKLLLFLQDKMVRRVGASHETRKHVDVKVVAATHLDLSAEVSAGRFRFDLYMRLGPAMRISLPALCERREEFPELIKTLVLKILDSDDMHPYIAQISRKSKVVVDFGTNQAIDTHALCVRFKPATRDLFLSYGWPGNTRELESVIDTLLLKALFDMRVASSPNKIIEIDHYYALSLLGVIGKSMPAADSSANTAPADESATILSLIHGQVGDFNELRQTLEKQYLCMLYKKCNSDLGAMGTALFGDGSKATRHKIMIRMNQLGVSLRTLKKS